MIPICFFTCKGDNMPFDASLDKELYKTEKDFGNTKIIVSVMSYNEGRPKIQLSRLNKSNDDWTFSKLGRLSVEEANEVFLMIQEAIKHC